MHFLADKKSNGARANSHRGGFLMKIKWAVWMVLLLGIVSLTAGLAWGQDDPAQKAQYINEIVEKNGIQGQLTNIPAMFQNQFLKLDRQDENSKEMAGIVKNDFTAENIAIEIKRTFSEKYNDKYTQEVLKFYNSELGARIAQCEIASSDPAFSDKRQDFNLDNYSPNRRKIVTKLFDDMKALDFSYLLYSSMFDSTIAAISVILPQGNRAFTSKMNEYKKQIKENVYSEENKQRLLADCYIMYEPLTDDELVTYSNFNRSKHGAWMNKCIETGMVNGFKKCTQKVINDIMEYAINKQSNTQDSGKKHESSAGKVQTPDPEDDSTEDLDDTY